MRINQAHIQGLKKRRFGMRAACVYLGGLLAMALFADCLASDLPVALRHQGQFYLLPGLTRPAELRALDNQQLRAGQATRPVGDWALYPLCEYGSEQQPQITQPPPSPPSGRHWLGTDDRGRDLFARLVHGIRVSLFVGIGSAALSMLIGVTLGLLAAYMRGRVDWVVLRLIELGLTFPTLFLVLIVMALCERTSILIIVLMLGVTGWTEMARLVRAEGLRLRELDFVAAARAAGAGPMRVICHHLLPNTLGPIRVHAMFSVAGAIFLESALTFLGFGTPPPTASWGEILSQAYAFPGSWWLTLCPGILLFLTVFSLNILGEGLRDRHDPRPLHGTAAR